MLRRIFLLIILPSILLTGCVIDAPPEEVVINLTLNITYNSDTPQFRTIEYQSKASSGYQARYGVALYRYASDKPESKPEYVFVYQESQMQDRSYTVKIAPDNYKVLVWSDYVDGETAFYQSPAFDAKASEDPYFEVSLTNDTYTGNSQWREAFYGAQEADLSAYTANPAQHTIDIVLERPHARFNFVATDKEDFIAYWVTKGTKSLDYTDLGVKITYPEYLPCTFNLLKDRPVDARTGMSFVSQATMLEDGTLDLGYDWVFANADQTIVIVSLSFYDPDGQLISAIPNIEVPLCRGRNTTIRGALLTSGIDTGVAIEPGYGGRFVVPL